MKILLKPLGLKTGEALHEHIIRRLSMALAHVAKHLDRVVVRLMDTNGPRGGIDKTCAIFLESPSLAPVRVTASSTDYFAAVDQAARRAERAAERALNRRWR